MPFFTEADFTHQPNEDPNWQESFVLVFRDPLSGAVGFLRTGCYPNRGTTQTHWGMALPDGTRFRRNQFDRKMEPGDRTETSQSSGNLKFSLPNLEYARFEGYDDDAEFDLRVYDWFPSQDWSFVGGPNHGQEVGRVKDQTSGILGAAGHPESGGRLEGRIRFGDRWIEVQNGFGYREHGYGPRADALTFRVGRNNFGTVGPNLSWSLVSMQDPAGAPHKFGYVYYNGKREPIHDFHHVACVLNDGFSVIGGWSVVQLENGETLRIEVDTIDGIVTSMINDNGGPGSTPGGNEAISIARWNGQAGVCDFNIIDNPRLGEAAVKPLFLANGDVGLTRRPIDINWVR